MLLPLSYISLPPVMAATRNSSMGPSWRIDLMTHHTTSEHWNTSRSMMVIDFTSIMKDRSDNPSHHEWMLYTGYTSRSMMVIDFTSSMKDRSDDPSHHEWTLYHGNTSHSMMLIDFTSIMKYRSDNPSHHEWMLYLRATSHSHHEG